MNGEQKSDQKIPRSKADFKISFCSGAKRSFLEPLAGFQMMSAAPTDFFFDKFFRYFISKSQ